MIACWGFLFTFLSWIVAAYYFKGGIDLSSLGLFFVISLSTSFLNGFLLWFFTGKWINKIFASAPQKNQAPFGDRQDGRTVKEQPGTNVNHILPWGDGEDNKNDDLDHTIQALKISQDYLKNVLDSINDAIFVVDVDKVKVLDCNQKAVEMFGYTSDEFKNLTPDDINSTDNKYSGSGLIPFFDKVRNGEEVLFEWQLRNKAGESIWAGVNMRLATIGGTPQVLISIRNINESKKIQESLLKSEELYRVITENMKDVVWILDINTNHFRYVSPSVEDLRGFTVEEVVSAPLDSIFMQPAIREFKEKIKQRAEDFLSGKAPAGQYFIEEIEQTCRNGSSVWTEINTYFLLNPENKHLELHGVARNITERKKAERIVRQNNRRLEAIHEIDRAILSMYPFNRISELVINRLAVLVSGDCSGFIRLDDNGLPLWQVNLPEGCSGLVVQNLFINKLASPGEELICLPDISLIPQEDFLFQQLQEKNIHSLIVAPLNVEGKSIGLLYLGSVSENHFDQVHHEILLEMVNILAMAYRQESYRLSEKAHTEELEQRVRQRTAELENSNKELESFTYSISHDLKAPLRIINGFSHILQEDFSANLGKEGAAHIERISFNIKRMNQMIDDLLAYSRFERSRMVVGPVIPPDLVKTLLEECQDDIISNRVEIIVDLPQHPVSADREGLLHALRNLINNALKFSKNAAHPRIEIGGTEMENHYLLWVRDNGIGFDMQNKDRIFDIFHRLNNEEEYGGTGIGLALVRKAMQRFGGRVWAESEPGKGAVFYLEIPY